MTENFYRLVALLRELFQMDRPDLDFGIYRIMNQKRKDVSTFLENDLLPQVRKELSTVTSGGKVLAELNATIKQARELGADPEHLPKVLQLREQLAAYGDLSTAENEIYSHLYNFFRRYYKDGDFLSLRRYKKDVYAIPYEGEEVKLHWANADQYYIKSAENFRDYAFLVGETPTEGQEDVRKRVHFKLVEADTEVANNKAQEGKERRFMLCDDTPMLEENGELIIRFEYKPTAKKQNQKSLNEAAVKTILGNAAFVGWVRLLAQEDNGRSCLEKHLNIYTARNTFDYFIHKDLGGFLRRELDFYIKNEVLFLDDIENQASVHVQAQLMQIRVLRRIAHKIIRFLEQIENFQKKLWLKKKFVVETNYLITLDRVPEELYPEIAANGAQREEWVRLFAIDEIKKEMMRPGYSIPLTVEFLKCNDKFVLDTRFFDTKFKIKLTGNIENIDDTCSGVLLHSENFQALNFLQSRYREKIKCVYIDPPYNTENDTFPYKDGYKASAWFSMMHDRARIASFLMEDNAVFFQQIGDDESARSRLLLEGIFQERKNSVVARRGIKNVQAQFSDISKLNLGHDVIHVCVKKSGIRLPHLQHNLADRKPGKWDTFWRGTDRPTMRYELLGNNPTKGQWRWEKFRAFSAVDNYKIYLKTESHRKLIDEWYVENLQSGVDLDFVRINDEGTIQYYVPPQNFRLVSDNWLDIPATGNFTEFPHEKSISLLQRIIGWITCADEIVLDYFAGSGSTGHACIRFEHDIRRYVLIEMGEYFESVLKPRIEKIIYSASWKDGKPTDRRTGISHCCKYLRLESYEDTLNNLVLKRTSAQRSLLADTPSLKEEYMLSYMMDLEAEGSASLLNVDTFTDPWNYTLKIASGSAGETRIRPVDLVETFNYLLGLTVIRRVVIRGIEVVEGTSPEGEKVLVIWRNTTKVSNVQLDEFFRKQEFNPRDTEFHLIYVNGDNNLENLKRTDETWKVRLTEEEFKRLMFDVEDV